MKYSKNRITEFSVESYNIYLACNVFILLVRAKDPKKLPALLKIAKLLVAAVLKTACLG